jgi:DNA replication licensing factor MCM2
LFNTVIEANNIKRKSEVDNINYLEEDKNLIRKWALKPKIADIIINSVAPSIYGHKDVKTGIALAMFGGVSKDI